MRRSALGRDRRSAIGRWSTSPGHSASPASWRRYWYLLYPLLVVPSPASYLFFAAWFVLMGLTVAWWRHHPIRSFLVPIVSVPAAVLALWIGTTFLNWAP